ncbi:MAG TPA: hypothetical protein VG734_01665 [Lacunisphaera sp.]|nr:hypothetical protein [Lacunisphaera sp.]
MSRLVPDQRIAAAAARGQFNAATEPSKQEKLENYLERVAKFIPVEIVAAFITIRGLFSASGWPHAIEFAIYGGLAFLTPVYLYFLGGAVPRKALQLIASTISFVVWSYGIGGPFFFDALAHAIGHKLDYPGLSGAIVIIWSLVIGLIQPKA